jgi:Flp pilus assembly pilin Flp
VLYNYYIKSKILLKGGDFEMLYPSQESGQGLVEYALIIAFIAILIIVALGWFTGGLNSMYSRIAAAL